MTKFPRARRGKVSVAELLRQAVARYQSGELEEARVRCEQVLALAPGNLIALELSGTIAVLAGQFGKGAELLSRALKVDANRAATHANLGFALHELEQFDAALAVLDAAVQLEPGNAAAHNNCGRTLHALGRLEDALDSYSKAIGLKPDFAEA
jgi:tetratricopeptide (TPR) repeat protein